MVDISIVMPCLNERESLGHCIANAREALDQLAALYGLAGEIVIADNGSTDGSQEIAAELGARVAPVSRRGYGAALRGGFEAARGRYLVMGDADGSYDFRDAVAMVAALAGGADICMGSRFKGGIAPGAMPWKNRYIGNPILTGVLNLFFRASVSDAHCGLRALTRRSFVRLQLSGDGMEFASEMVVKASLLGLKIAEAPATLSPDLRNRPPHLRPWRDGWRHLRFLLLMSPAWLFAAPAAVLGAIGAFLMMGSLVAPVVGLPAAFFGAAWTILGGALVTLAHQTFLFSLAAQHASIQAGVRPASAKYRRWSEAFTLERLLVGGALISGAGLLELASVTAFWSAHDYRPLPHVLPAVLGTTLLAVGFQTMMCGFFVWSMVDGRPQVQPQPSAEPAPAPAAAPSAPAARRSA
ncbi:glycosyltransferase family 2 protein [Alsobacter sp. SYSU BS001988]